MNIEKVAFKGSNEWYEDETIVNEGLALYGVIDGATSLEPYRGRNGETGAYLAAQIVKQAFESESDKSIEIQDLAIKANAILSQSMHEAGIDTRNKAALWSCALACIKINEHTIDYVQAADCMIIARYTDGGIRLLTRDQVAVVGKLSMALYDSYIAEGKTHNEAVTLIKPQLAENRFRANQANGYTVLNGEAELATFLEHGTINRNGLEALYVMSDGMFLPSLYYKNEAEQWIKTIEYIDKLSLEGYVNWLIAEEQADRECIKYKRFKISDDKTAIKITF